MGWGLKYKNWRERILHITKRGVFQIKNLINNKIYVGSSVNLDTSYRNIKTFLNKNTHNNKEFQSDWNSYGESNFEYSILQICDKDDNLSEITKYWINTLHSCKNEGGYNIIKNYKNSKDKTDNDSFCTICNCSKEETSQMYGIKNKFKKILCSKHYCQLLTHGKIIDESKPSVRNSKLDNEIILYDTHAEICLYNRRGEEVARALIDLEDVEKCKGYKWYWSGKRYVRTITSNVNIMLHQHIYDVQEGNVIDHIDRNPLNNRKNNLRDANNCQNAQNINISIRNTSGVIGVCWNKSVNKWVARIQTNNKRVLIGYYSDFQEAVKARTQAELEEWKEFSPLSQINT